LHYFESFLVILAILPLNWEKAKNNLLIRQKNTKEIIIAHKGTSMAKDGEDYREHKRQT